jgi:hypothetical protein
MYSALEIELTRSGEGKEEGKETRGERGERSEERRKRRMSLRSSFCRPGEEGQEQEEGAQRQIYVLSFRPNISKLSQIFQWNPRAGNFGP